MELTELYSCFNKIVDEKILNLKVDKKIFSTTVEDLVVDIFIKEKNENYILFKTSLNSKKKSSLENSFLTKAFNIDVFKRFDDNIKQTLIDSHVFYELKHGKLSKINKITSDIDKYDSNYNHYYLSTNKNNNFQTCYFNEGFKPVSTHGYHIDYCNLLLESFFYYDLKTKKTIPYFYMKFNSGNHLSGLYYAFNFKGDELDINELNEETNQLKLRLDDYAADKICTKLNISFDNYINNKESYLEIYKLQNY